MTCILSFIILLLAGLVGGCDGEETLFFAKTGKFNIFEKKLAVIRGQMDKRCGQKVAVGRCKEVAVV